MDETIETAIATGTMCYFALTFIAGMLRSACNTATQRDDAKTRSIWGGIRDCLSGYGAGRWVGDIVSQGGTACVFATNGTIPGAPRPRLATDLERGYEAYNGFGD